MAEHPPVTITRAQYRQLEPFFPYTIPPELSAALLRLSALLLEIALPLVQLGNSDQKTRALASLEETSMWAQQAFNADMGIPQPPSWLHVERPDRTQEDTA